MAQGYRRGRITIRLHRLRGVRRTGTIHRMKSLIAIVVLAVVGAVIYKILTAEVPIDES